MTMKIEKANNYIKRFAALIEEGKTNSYAGDLKVGVDLGTSNIVLSVLSAANEPVAGAIYPASVVKDGLVVDYVGAVEIVKELKQEVEAMLGGITLTHAATAVPPGTIGGNKKAMQNVLESAFFEVSNIVDEPAAAATVLGITDGAVVDVGGGTTGISIFKNGEIIYTADEPTGGTHMGLVLAGYYKIDYAEADRLKRAKDRESTVYPIIKPVVEKMAAIVKRHIQRFDVDSIYVVGGASSFTEFEKTFFTEIGMKTIKPIKPLLITPLGIAMNDTGIGVKQT